MIQYPLKLSGAAMQPECGFFDSFQFSAFTLKFHIQNHPFFDRGGYNIQGGEGIYFLCHGFAGEVQKPAVLVQLFSVRVCYESNTGEFLCNLCVDVVVLYMK